MTSNILEECLPQSKFTYPRAEYIAIVGLISHDMLVVLNYLNLQGYVFPKIFFNKVILIMMHILFHASKIDNRATQIRRNQY